MGVNCGCDGGHVCDRCTITALESRIRDLEARLDANGDDLMGEAWKLTNGDRRAAYGDAREVFTAYGWAWSAILAPKLKPGAFVDAADATLMMASLKVCREAHKVKRDNVVDAHGYLSLHSRVTDLLVLPEAPPPAGEWDHTLTLKTGTDEARWSCGCVSNRKTGDVFTDCGQQAPKCARLDYSRYLSTARPIPAPPKEYTPLPKRNYVCGCITVDDSDPMHAGFLIKKCEGEECTRVAAP